MTKTPYKRDTILGQFSNTQNLTQFTAWCSEYVSTKPFENINNK